MLAIHDQPFAQQMRSRLKFAVMGLGLVRLLQDAGLTEEARTTLHSLENGVRSTAEDLDKPGRTGKPWKRHNCGKRSPRSTRWRGREAS